LPGLYARIRGCGSSVELLLGTRGLCVDQTPAGVSFMAVNGALLILHACRSFGLPVRLVTYEQRLRTVLGPTMQPKVRPVFGVIYAGEEDDIVPIDLVSSVTTERRTYSPEEVVSLLRA
jgi:hypothetical protein